MYKQREKKVVTGVYGGSFNPIHIGHTGMATELAGRGLVDEMWLIVSPQNPLKDSGLWDDDLRLQLARIATEGIQRVKVSDVEFHLPRPNYMITTLETLSAKHTDREFVLVIGMDNWNCFHRWHKWDDILSRYRIIVLPRESGDGSCSAPKERGGHVSFVDVPLINISSTWIRSEIDNNPNYDGEGLDDQVWRYIKEKLR